MLKRYNDTRKKKSTFRQYMEIARFYMILNDYTADDLAAITGVHIKTARRWLKESHGVSPGNKMLIRLASAGHIIPDELKDCLQFIGEYLVIDGVHSFDPEQLRGYWLALQEMQWVKRDLKEADLKIQNQQDYIEYLENQLNKKNIIAFPAEKARPSETTGHERNPFFKKPNP